MSRVVTMTEMAYQGSAAHNGLRGGRTLAASALGEEGTSRAPLGHQGVLDWLQGSAQALDVGSLVRAAHGAPDEARFWAVLESGVEHVLHNPPPDMTEAKKEALRGLQLALRAVRDALRVPNILTGGRVPNTLGGGVPQPRNSKRRRDNEGEDDEEEEEEDDEEEGGSAAGEVSGREAREASEESSEESEEGEKVTALIARIEEGLQRQQQQGDEAAPASGELLRLLRGAIEGDDEDAPPGQAISADQLPALLCTAVQTARAASILDLRAIERLGELIVRAKHTPGTASPPGGGGRRRVRRAPSLWAELKAGRGDPAAVAALRTIPPSRCKGAVRLHLLAVLLPSILRVWVGYTTVVRHATAILEHVRNADAATQALWGFDSSDSI